MPPMAAYLEDDLRWLGGLTASEAWSRSAAPARSEFLQRGAPLSNLSKYPPSFLRFAKRLRERNEAALAMALGKRCRYFDAPTRDGGATCRRFEAFLEKNFGGGGGGDDGELRSSSSPLLVDASHPQLQNAYDGSNLVDGAKLVQACGPSMVGFFAATLQTTVSTVTLASALRACPNLLCVCLTECDFDDVVAKALPWSLRSLRLSECAGLDDKALAAAIQVSAESLVSLDVESSDPEQTAKVPGPKTARALADCKGLTYLRLSDRGCPRGLVDLQKLCATAMGPDSHLLGSLQTLHLEHRFPERTAPASPAFLDALGRLEANAVDLDGFRLPKKIQVTDATNLLQDQDDDEDDEHTASSSSTKTTTKTTTTTTPNNTPPPPTTTENRHKTRRIFRKVNRLIVSPEDLRRRDLQAYSSSASSPSSGSGSSPPWPALRELVVAYDSAERKRRGESPGTSPVLGPLDQAALRLFRDLGHLTSLVLRVELRAGQLADVAPFLPKLRHCALNGALSFGNFYDTVTDYDDAPGNHDGDLRALARHCRDLRALDLSGALDAAYAVFSEAAVAHVVDRLPHLTDIFLFECGRKWDFRRVPTKGGRVNVHY